MTKVFRFGFLASIMIAMIGFSGCGSKDGDDGNDGNGGTENCDCNLTASVTLPEGWKKVYAVNGESWERDDYIWACVDLFSECIPSKCKTAEDFAKYNQSEMKKNLDCDFGPVSKIKVGGRDAVTYEYTMYSLRKDKLIHICTGNCAYSINVGSMTATYASLADDFQAIIDSYTLK